MANTFTILRLLMVILRSGVGKFTKELNFRTLQITGVLIEAKLIITAH